MDGMLDSLSVTGRGYYIGGCFLGTPTVADDIMLIDSTCVGLKNLLNSAHTSSDDRRSDIHPVKSEVAPITGIDITNKPLLQSKNCITVTALLGSSALLFTDAITHMGLSRNLVNNNANIDERIKHCRPSTPGMP